VNQADDALPLSIVPAESATQLDLVRKLLLEYWSTRNLGISVFSFDRELAGLPGEYGPPSGRLLLA
jgi:putative acetyltransferase